MTEEEVPTDPASPPVAVVHERSGLWARQLRARLAGTPARWFEVRSRADLMAAVSASTSPVVVIEAPEDPAGTLSDLAQVVADASAARILLLDPRGRPEVLQAGRDLGATLAAASGRFTPPEVAALIGRWLRLSAREVAAQGWTRPLPADPARDPSAWLDQVVAEAARSHES